MTDELKAAIEAKVFSVCNEDLHTTELPCMVREAKPFRVVLAEHHATLVKAVRELQEEVEQLREKLDQWSIEFAAYQETKEG